MLVSEVFEAGFRATAKRLHPDVGGSHSAMQRLNDLAGNFRTQLQGLTNGRVA